MKRFWVTPTLILIGLLIAEVLLWGFESLRWLGKGWGALISVASAGLAVLVIVLWIAGSAVFQWRCQLSIRSVLVLVTAVAIPCGWLASETELARRQREMVETIREHGGRVLYDYQKPFGTRAEQNEPTGPRWLRNLLGDNFFSEVENAWIRSSDVTDADLANVKYLPELTALNLSNTNITDAGLVHFETLSQLKVLFLEDTKITGAEMGHLEGLTHLEDLSLTRCKVTSAGLEQIARLTQLRSLSLHGTNVANGSLVHLKRLLQLNQLYLGETGVTDVGLEFLTALRQLKRLSLANTGVTDAGLTTIGRLTDLRWLDVAGTKITDAGVKDFQQALPNCSISR